jgi:hypothetical protein
MKEDTDHITFSAVALLIAIFGLFAFADASTDPNRVRGLSVSANEPCQCVAWWPDGQCKQRSCGLAQKDRGKNGGGKEPTLLVRDGCGRGRHREYGKVPDQDGKYPSWCVDDKKSFALILFQSGSRWPCGSMPPVDVRCPQGYNAVVDYEIDAYGFPTGWCRWKCAPRPERPVIAMGEEGQLCATRDKSSCPKPTCTTAGETAQWVDVNIDPTVATGYWKCQPSGLISAMCCDIWDEFGNCKYPHPCHGRLMLAQDWPTDPSPPEPKSKKKKKETYEDRAGDDGLRTYSDHPRMGAVYFSVSWMNDEPPGCKVGEPCGPVPPQPCTGPLCPAAVPPCPPGIPPDKCKTIPGTPEPWTIL